MKQFFDLVAFIFFLVPFAFSFHIHNPVRKVGTILRRKIIDRRNSTSEIDKLRIQSKLFTKIIVVEFAYCSTLYFIENVYLIHYKLTTTIYLLLIILIPLIFNISIYLMAKVKSDTIRMNHAIIIQILVLLFSVKFLI